ncbi:MAG: sodium:solute symporter family protein [Proteobacteria bacterium]|nr:sodium:solute symporter family protein [Pseudomonadota bacterium]
MNTLLLAAILAYVVVQFAIGAWFSRRMHSEQDYILAGRSLGPHLVAFSIFATWFGAEAIVASAGEVYSKGLPGALTDPFGYGGAVLIVGLLLAAPLWRRGIVTYADMVRQRFAPAVEKLFVIVLLPGSVLWAAAQIRAFGQILASETGMTLSTGIFLAAVLVGGYSVVGGLLADAITDVVQGIAVIIGLVVLTVFIAAHFGGIGPALSSVPPERLAFAGDESLWLKLEKLAIVICGSLVAVELVSRFLGARSAHVAATGTVVGGLMYIALGLLPMFLGLVGPTLVPNLGEPEQIVPKLAEAHLPPLAGALFIGALVSAILSVVHAALHAPAAQLSHNVVLRFLPTMSAEGRLMSVRVCVLLLSVVAWSLARTVDTIKELVELASAFGSAGAMVVAVFGLFTSFGGPYAALGALVTGSLGWAGARFVFGLETPYLIALAASFAIYIAVGMLEARRSAA